MEVIATQFSSREVIPLMDVLVAVAVVELLHSIFTQTQKAPGQLRGRYQMDVGRECKSQKLS